ncbi:MAG: hypothetical protein ACJASQ_000830 [Crocinitomicaceae bacterium]|jgi:hypothetical protein
MTEKKQSKNKVTYEIPKEGSLGLLAYGDKGLRAWRKVRDKKNEKPTK